MQVPEGIKGRICYDTIQSTLWQALAHQDLYLAILKSWPTFQAPLTVWMVEDGKRPDEIWHVDVRALDGWHSYWKESNDLAIQAVLFHLRHARAALAMVAQLARISKSWYRHCQATVPPSTSADPIARTRPLRLDIHRSVGSFHREAFLSMPLDEYFHRTDLYLHRLPMSLLIRARTRIGGLKANLSKGFLLYTVNYYRHLHGDAGWHQHTYEMTGPDYALQKHSLQCLWFQMSHRIDRQFESQIMPRHDMRTMNPCPWYDHCAGENNLSLHLSTCKAP